MQWTTADSLRHAADITKNSLWRAGSEHHQRHCDTQRISPKTHCDKQGILPKTHCATQQTSPKTHSLWHAADISKTHSEMPGLEFFSRQWPWGIGYEGEDHNKNYKLLEFETIAKITTNKIRLLCPNSQLAHTVMEGCITSIQLLLLCCSKGEKSALSAFFLLMDFQLAWNEIQFISTVCIWSLP